MIAAPLPANENVRLDALRAYNLLDTPPEAVFDDLTALAAYICGVPIALVSLVDANRQWFKSRHGLDALETPRDVSFCGHAILQDEVFIVPDSHSDPRFHDNPLVTGDPSVRFYAGVPLTTSEGHALGALCVIDQVPRTLEPAQIELLRSLGRLVINQFELRQATEILRDAEQMRLQAEAERQESFDLLQATFDAIEDAILVVDNASTIVYVNQQFGELWRIPPAVLATRDDKQVLPRALEQMADPHVFLSRVQALYAEPEATSQDILHFKDGRVIERYSRPQRVGSTTVGRMWGFRDITARVESEQAQRHLQEELIRAQSAALAELSTPLIPLNKHTLVMPLIGSIDTHRAQSVLEALLEGVSRSHAQTVILDITGVPVIDTQIASSLVRAAMAVNLLGAQLVLTGIRPEVAQTLVGLGVNLHGIITRSTLQSGIEFALGR